MEEQYEKILHTQTLGDLAVECMDDCEMIITAPVDGKQRELSVFFFLLSDLEDRKMEQVMYLLDHIEQMCHRAKEAAPEKKGFLKKKLKSAAVAEFLEHCRQVSGHPEWTEEEILAELYPVSFAVGQDYFEDIFGRVVMTGDFSDGMVLVAEVSADMQYFSFGIGENVEQYTATAISGWQTPKKEGKE